MEPCGTLRNLCGTFWSLVEHLWSHRGTLWNPLKAYLAPDHPTPLAEPRPPRSPCRTWCNNGGTLVGPFVEPSQTTPDHPEALAEPGGTLVEPWSVLLWNLLKPPRTTPKPSQNLVEHWWNPGGEPLWNLTSNHPGPPRSPRRIWWNPGGEPLWNLTSNHPGPPRSPRRALVEHWWNPRGTSPQTTPDHPATLAEPGGTLVEPSSRGTLPQTTRSPRRTWWKSGGTLPQTTPDHPAALAEPGGTLVEPSWNPRGTLPQGRPGPPRTLSGLRPQSFQLLGKKGCFFNTKRKGHHHLQVAMFRCIMGGYL